MFGQGNHGPQHRPRPPGPPAVQPGFPQQPPPNIGIRPFQAGPFPPPPPLPMNMVQPYGHIPPQFNAHHGHMYGQPMAGPNVPIVSQGMPHGPRVFAPGPPLPSQGQGFYGTLPLPPPPPHLPPPPSFLPAAPPFQSFARGPGSDPPLPSAPLPSSSPPPPPPSSPPPLSPPPPPPAASPSADYPVTSNEGVVVKVDVGGSSQRAFDGPSEASPRLVESCSEPVDAKVEVIDLKASSGMDNLENVGVGNSPAPSDVDMEDDMDSSSMEDVSPVRSSSGVQEHSKDDYMQKAAEETGVFIKDESPFRLIQGYASDDSGENDEVLNDEITNPVRGSKLAVPNTQDLVTEVQSKDKLASCEPPSIPGQSSVQPALQNFTNSQLSGEKDALESDSIHPDTVGNLQPKEARESIGQPNVDEYGRLVREAVCDSDSDTDRCNEKRGKRARSSSRGLSPKDDRHRRRSRSPRRRDKRSQSSSWSPRRSRSPREARRINTPRKDHGKPLECINFVRGRCSRGASCRFLHQDSGQDRGRKYHNQQIQDDSGKHEQNHTPRPERGQMVKKPLVEDYKSPLRKDTVQLHGGVDDRVSSKSLKYSAGDDELVQAGKISEQQTVDRVIDEENHGRDTELIENMSEAAEIERKLQETTTAEPLNAKTRSQSSLDGNLQTKVIISKPYSDHARGEQQPLSELDPTSFPSENSSVPLGSLQHSENNPIHSVYGSQHSQSEMVPSLRPPNFSVYSSNAQPFNATWTNFPIPQHSNVSDFSGASVSGMQYRQANFPQPALPLQNEFVQPSGPPFQSGQFSHSPATDAISQPLHQAGHPRQLPLLVGNQQDQPSHRENRLPLPPKSDAPRSFNPNDQNLPHGDVSGSYPGQGSIAFTHGSIIQPQILPPRESFINSQSLPADSFSSHQRPSLQQSLAKSVFSSNFGHTGKVDSSLQNDRNMVPQLPDIGVTKTSITMHHNPFASTFEHDPSSIKFSSASGRANDVDYNTKYDGSLSSSHNPVGILSSRLSSSPSHFRRQDEQLLPALGGVPHDASQVPFDFQKPKFKEYGAGAPYDPLLDSIEPSSATVKNLAPPWDQNIPVADAGTFSRLNKFDKTTDAEHSSKNKGNQFGEHNVHPDASDEMASDAEVGIVENESPRPFDGKEGSSDAPADLENTGAGEIEIDQVLSPGKAKKKKREQRSMKLFKIALAEFVKEVLKPSWRQGNMSKEAFKTIVKKTVDKVSGALPSHQVPKSKAKINQYVESSQRKLTKLVMGYVDKYVKM